MKTEENKALYLFLSIGIIFRVIMVIFHCTHYDDIGVANWIIYLLRTTENDTVGITKEFCNLWTYGPLQILLSQKLINEHMSYFLNIIMGRIPSLICNILFLFLMKNILQKIKPYEKKTIILIMCILSLSWENIIYSAQMEPYSIGILFSALVIYLMINKFYDNWNKTFVATLLFSLGCYAQYQLFILVFAAYIALFICNLKNKRSLLKIFFAGLINFTFSIPLLLFLLNTGKLSRSINWNIGKDGIFMYQNIPSENLLNKIFYTITFFSQNIFRCFKYLFLSDSFQSVSNILTIIFLLCASLGIYYIHKNKEYIILAIFNDLLTLIILIMVIKGNLTLGPSRHILFMEPIWIILIYFGILQLLNIQWLKKHYSKINTILICSIALLFAFSLTGELSTRKNFISEKYICSLINQYKPQFVFTERNLNDLYLFSVDGFSNSSEPLGNGWLEKININSQPQDKDTIILMSKNFNINDIRNIENSMRKQLEEKLIYFNLDIEWANLDRYKLIYKKEIYTNAETEYAREYYSNYPNGLYLYILEYCGN